MQSNNNMSGKQPQIIATQARNAIGSAKEITMKTLAQLKAKLYADAARAMKLNPSKADIIQKAVDRDAARLAFAINTVSVKM